MDQHQNIIPENSKQSLTHQNTTTIVNGAVQKKQWLGASTDMMGNPGMMMVPMQQRKFKNRFLLSSVLA